MATPGPRIALDENQTELTPPGGNFRLAYLWVVNGSGATAYISVWGGTGTSRTAGERSAGPWAVPDGHAGPVLIAVHAKNGAVLAAHTGSDVTGAPSSALDVVPFWEHG